MVKLAKSKSRCQSTFQRHLIWAAMEKVGKKELDSDQLEEGTSHTVSMHIEGTIDEQPFSEIIESLVTIGYQQQKTSSVNPQVAELVAWILSKLNRATRNRILSDLPKEFEEQDAMPKSSKVLVDEVNHMLLQLRQTKTVTARGPIRCEYVLLGKTCGICASGNCQCSQSSANAD